MGAGCCSTGAGCCSTGAGDCSAGAGGWTSPSIGSTTILLLVAQGSQQSTTVTVSHGPQEVPGSVTTSLMPPYGNGSQVGIGRQGGTTNSLHALPRWIRRSISLPARTGENVVKLQSDVTNASRIQYAKGFDIETELLESKDKMRNLTTILRVVAINSDSILLVT